MQLTRDTAAGEAVSQRMWERWERIREQWMREDVASRRTSPVARQEKERTNG